MAPLKKRLLLLCLSVITGSAVLSASYVALVAYLIMDDKSPVSDFKLLLLTGIPTTVAGVIFVWEILVKHVLRPVLDTCEFHENLLTNSTYELRSPLTSIKGNLEVALRRDRTVEEYKDTLRLLLRETDRSIDLLKNIQMLSLSRFKPLELFSEQVDLKLIIAERLELHSALIKAKGIRLEIDDQGDDFICVCDESLMGQTINNLVDKAVKYAPAGGTIKVLTRKNAEHVSLTVANTHDGRCMEEIQRFSALPYEGSEILHKNINGLEVGLYIARYVVGAHHGEMQVSAADDLFSVTISLPAHYVPAHSPGKQFEGVKPAGLSIVHGCPLKPAK